MIYPDAKNTVISFLTHVQGRPQSSLDICDQQKAGVYSSSSSNQYHGKIFVQTLMKIAGEAGFGHAHLDCIEVSDKGLVEGLIITEPYYYYKAIGRFDPTSHMMKSLIGNHGLFSLFDDGFGGANCDKIRMFMQFNAKRTLTILDCVMCDGWRF